MTSSNPSRDGARRLVVAATLPAPVDGDRVVLPAKFVDGMARFAAEWAGPVVAVVERSERPSANLDNQPWEPAKLPFGLRVADFGTEEFAAAIADARLLVGVPDHRVGMASLARARGMRSVLVTENTLRTRRQIAAVAARSWPRRLRTWWWEGEQERRIAREVRAADGLQCNGVPTWAAYRRWQPDALLFFDTRTSADLLPDAAEIAARRQRLLAGAPLRLVFSGRLTGIKGVDHLPRVAAELRRRGVRFTLDVYGDGDLGPAVRAALAAPELADSCRVHGAAPFRDGLVPALRRGADLFVCCHRQGDPSCTYMETLACGVPIAGYANEAWAGMQALRDVGWLAPMDEPAALAAAIAAIDGDRRGLAAKAERAWQWGAESEFGATFARRVAHFAAVADGEARPPRA